MSQVTASISMSLDAYVTGPNPTPERQLGEGGEPLHSWFSHHTADRCQRRLNLDPLATAENGPP